MKKDLETTKQTHEAERQDQISRPSLLLLLPLAAAAVSADAVIFLFLFFVFRYQSASGVWAYRKTEERKRDREVLSLLHALSRTQYLSCTLSQFACFVSHVAAAITSLVLLLLLPSPFPSQTTEDERTYTSKHASKDTHFTSNTPFELEWT